MSARIGRPPGKRSARVAHRPGGLVSRQRSRQTGRTVSIYHGLSAGLDDAEGTQPWSTVCDDHGHVISHPTLALAQRHARDPLGWCEVCNGADTG